MADKWVIAYDIDIEASKKASVTTMTVYNRIKATLAQEGFTDFAQLSVYAMPEEDGALVKVFKAIRALNALPERRYIKRLHVFKIDGAMNDVLPLVDSRASAPAD
jgi:virulence-associated protein VapD